MGRRLKREIVYEKYTIRASLRVSLLASDCRVSKVDNDVNDALHYGCPADITS